MGMMTTFKRAGLGLVAGLLLIGPALAAVDIQEGTSPGGTKFWMVQDKTIPIVAVDLSFKGGARLDPQGKAGLTTLMAGLLEEGAGDMDATGFAKRKDALSARFGFDAGRDSVSVSARMLAENLDDSADLLALALTKPSFSADAIERVRAQMMSNVAARETDPNAVASKVWFARAFPDHPYGTPPDGTAESIPTLTRDDIVAQHDKLLNRASVTIGIVGDVDAETAGKLVDRIVGGLPEGKPHPAEKLEDQPPAGIKVEQLDVPQSVAVFGQKGLDRKDPDYIPAYVMNHILGGGGFSSILMEEVREKRGLAYGVYSYLAQLDAEPLILGGVQTANERIGESLDIIRQQWAKMADGEVTGDQLDKAKKYLTGAFPLRFDSNAKIASYLVQAQEEDLGIDYINRRNDLIEAVTLDDIKRVAKRLLEPDQLSIVVVGKPVGL